MVYFARGIKSGNIKIGMSGDPLRRLATVGRQNGEKMELLAVIPGAYQKERQIHIQFEEFNLGGEWFYPVTEIFNFIDDLPASCRRCRIPSSKYYDREKKLVVRVSKETFARLERFANDSGRNLSNLAGEILNDSLPTPYRATPAGTADATLRAIGIEVVDAADQPTSYRLTPAGQRVRQQQAKE